MQNGTKRIVRIRLAATGSQLMMRGKAGELRRALRAAGEVRPLYVAALERAEECLAWHLAGAVRTHGYTSELMITVAS